MLAAGWTWLVDWTHGKVDPVPELLDRAHQRLADDDVEEAVKLLDDVIARDPRNVVAIFYRADTRWVEGELKGANSDAKRLVDLATEIEREDPLMFAIREWRVRGWLLVGLTSEHLDEEVDADVAFAEVERLACAAERRGDMALLEPRSRAREARWNLAGALLDRERIGEPGWRTAVHRAHLMRRLGDVDQAIAVLDEALGADDAVHAVVALRATRWLARTVRGDPDARDDVDWRGDLRDLHRLVRIQRAVESLLAADKDSVRALFADQAPTAANSWCWTWPCALGLRPAVDPPEATSAWDRSVQDRLLGRMTDAELLARARVASGPRNRARHLHEAHGTLALVAYAAGDVEAELSHLHEAARRGDMGSGLDAWIHARARQLGSPVRHVPPRGEQ